MKTTIFPPDQEPGKKTEQKKIALRIGNLILTCSYLVIIPLLTISPVHHGYSGMGRGMGNNVNISLPLLYILFSLLIIVHLVYLYQSYKSRFPWHIIMLSHIGMIISATFAFSLLFFVRQSLNLFHSSHFVPYLVYFSLACSFLLGIFGVIDLVRKRGQLDDININGLESSFPLPTNRYQKVRILAEGGVGIIWYAERKDDDLPVVVKVPRRIDEKTGISFLQEISVWKDLDHPNIATVLSVNILPFPYIEIEYLPGSLEEMKKPVSLLQAVRIIRCLVSALVYAHDRGVAHCDIKPSNILLTGNGVPKLTDWGLSRSGSSRWWVSGFSPLYAAPEQHQLTPECGYSTDIWQIGMVFAELLTGKAGPLSGTEQVFLTQGGAVILPILQKCLAPDPGDRYLSAKALRSDLDLGFPPDKCEDL